MSDVVGIIARILLFAEYLYLIALFARMILDLVPAINREWRPRGFALVLAEFVYTITDPPVKFFRRVIPPLRLGPIALDLGFSLTFLIMLVLISFTGIFAR
ncbi:YggT family protein [Microbacterium gorillae]|uniref:YggT family protein n=1 Tax=Microbacterium gorillae TaxID=1231063 RepID=UPI000694C9C6|nr:YggT family protein [Microbacterium gorillae]